MTNPSTKLPCPFCGCADIFVEPDERGSGGQWVSPIHVGCMVCKAEQTGDEPTDAIVAWNRRAAAPAQPTRELDSPVVRPLTDAQILDWIRTIATPGVLWTMTGTEQMTRFARAVLKAAGGPTA